MKLDRRPGEANYRLLAQRLREEIHRSDYAENKPLPTEMSLAASYGLSRQTVRRALQELVSEGLIFRVRGRGTFVTPKETRYLRPFGTVDDLLNLTADTQFELISPLSQLTRDDELLESTGGAPTDFAQLTNGLNQDWLYSSRIYGVTFVRRHNGQIICRTRVTVPAHIAEVLSRAEELTNPAFQTRTTVIGLIENFGFNIAEAEQIISARAASVELSELLRVPVGHPILHVVRIYFDRQGQLLERAVSDFVPELFSHFSRLGRVGQHVPSPEDH